MNLIRYRFADVSIVTSIAVCGEEAGGWGEEKLVQFGELFSFYGKEKSIKGKKIFLFRIILACQLLFMLSGWYLVLAKNSNCSA